MPEPSQNRQPSWPITVAALLLAFGPAVASFGADREAKRPNVVLVMTDDQGYGDLGCHGNAMINTPNLDQLYDQSVRLTDFHVSPLCTPTRAGLMTGQNPVRLGAWGTTWGRSLPREDAPMMADVFVAAGYRSGFFGKWHLGDNYPFRPRDRGFQEVLAHGGGGVGQTPDYWGNDYFDDTYFHNGKPRKFTGYCTDVWFDAALEFIEANRKRPFFVYLSTNAPHGPLLVDPKYSDPYLAKGVPAAMAKFYGMIENIDENMGRLTAKLDDWSLRDNTIMIFLTDNGTANGIVPKPRQPAKNNEAGGSVASTWTGFNAGMRGKKGSLHEGGHRVPCFIRWPDGGLSGGRDVDILSAHLDLLPTLIELCNLEKPERVKFDGNSLASGLKGNETLPARTLVIQYRQSHEPPQKGNAAVISGPWRLLGGKQLFNVESDPGQEHDVSAENPQIVAKLERHYEAWWAEVSPGFDHYCRIVLGSAEENPTRLNAFDWHTSTPWNQGHVLNGAKANGFWAVRIAEDGEYRISLRRWPVEVDAPINAAIAGGKAIKATAARVSMGNVDLTRQIPQDAVEVTFQLKLERGNALLQTWFLDEQSGESRGAYYVIVERLAD